MGPILQPEGGTPTLRQFVMVMLAVTWFAVLLPVGAKAAGQLVTLADPTTTQQARVVAPGALRVAEYNDPARLAYRRVVTVTHPSGLGGKLVTFDTVPSDQRLVIDTLSVHVRVPTGQRAIIVYLSVSGTPFYVPLTFTGSTSESYRYQGMEHVQLYADPGTSLGASWSRNSSSGGASAIFSLSGHYVRI